MPKIYTTTFRLRHSGRICPEGWGKLLHGLGKRGPDHEQLDALRCLEIVGLYDALWMLPTELQYEREFRSLSLSFAQLAVCYLQHLELQDILTATSKLVDGQVSADEMAKAVPDDLKPHLWYPITSDDW